MVNLGPERPKIDEKPDDRGATRKDLQDLLSSAGKTSSHGVSDDDTEVVSNCFHIKGPDVSVISDDDPTVSDQGRNDTPRDHDDNNEDDDDHDQGRTYEIDIPVNINAIDIEDFTLLHHLPILDMKMK